MIWWRKKKVKNYADLVSQSIFHHNAKQHVLDAGTRNEH